MRMWTIYMFRNKANGKRYVGQTRLSVEERLAAHRKKAQPWSPLAFHRALAMGVLYEWQRTVLQRCRSQDAANAAELQWIRKLRTEIPKGYNMRLPPRCRKERAADLRLWVTEMQARGTTGVLGHGGKSRAMVNGKWQGPWVEGVIMLPRRRA
jgi:hypothetical protein